MDIVGLLLSLTELNYLAHAYLSFDDSAIMVGNIIGDSVKGKQYQDFPLNIQMGLLLHRRIDSFTDQHPKISSIKDYFRSEFGLYSGIVVDILCDHILAENFNAFTQKNLGEFSQKVYQNMELHQEILPESWQVRRFYMKKHDWLSQYATIEGIQQSFKGLNKRIFHDIDLSKSLKTFGSNKIEIKILFEDFFEEIIDYMPTVRKEISFFLANKE